MPNYPQSLLFTPGCSHAWLRELSGRDEQAVAGTGVDTALALIDRLWAEGHRQGMRAQDLAAPDRDRLLAAIYRHTYGDQVKGSIACRNCGEPFDMDFSLGSFVDHHHGQAPMPGPSRLPDGSFLLEGGLELRLPTGADELAVMHLDDAAAGKALLARIIRKGELDEAAAEAMAEEALPELAPMLQAEMAAQCPECGHGAAVSFDVQSYLLQSLLNDRDRLQYEVHRIASAYGWSLKDILKLSRSARRDYTRLIEAEMYTGLA